MGWASSYIERLRAGETVSFRPRGNSMAGKVNDGDLVTVEPLQKSDTIAVGDIVLCKVNGNEYLHLIKSIQGFQGGRYLIGNNRGGTNGWTLRRNIFGRCTKVE